MPLHVESTSTEARASNSPHSSTASGIVPTTRHLSNVTAIARRLAATVPNPAPPPRLSSMERGVPPRRGALHDSAWITGARDHLARPTTAPEQFRLPAFSVRARAADTVQSPSSPSHPQRPRRNQPRIPTPKEEEMLTRTLAPGGVVAGAAAALPSTTMLPPKHRIPRVPVPSINATTSNAQRAPTQEAQHHGHSRSKTLHTSSSVPCFDISHQGVARLTPTEHTGPSGAPAAVPARLRSQRPSTAQGTGGLPATPTASSVALRPVVTQHQSDRSVSSASALLGVERPAMTHHTSTSSAPAASHREDAPRPSMSHKLSSGSAPAVAAPADIERPRKRSIASRRASTAQGNQLKGEVGRRPSTALSGQSSSTSVAPASLTALSTRRPSDSRRIIDMEQLTDRSAAPGTPGSPWLTLNRNALAVDLEAASGSPASLRSAQLLSAEREPLSPRPRSGGLTPAPRQRRPGSSTAISENAAALSPPSTPIRSPPTWLSHELGASPVSSPSKSPLPDPAEPVVVSTARRVAVTTNTPRLIAAGLPNMRRGSTPQSSMSDLSTKASGMDSEFSFSKRKSTRSDSIASMASLPTTASTQPHPTPKTEFADVEALKDAEPQETIIASPPRNLEHRSSIGEAPAVGLTGLELGPPSDVTEELTDLYFRESWSQPGSPERLFSQLEAYDVAMSRGAAASALLSPDPLRDPEPVSPLTACGQMLQSGWSTETSNDSLTSDDGSDVEEDLAELSAAERKSSSEQLDLSPFSLISPVTAASTAATSPPTSSAADDTSPTPVPNFARPWDALHIEKKAASLRSQPSDTAMSERTDRASALTVSAVRSAAQIESKTSSLSLSRHSTVGDAGHDILAADESEMQIEQLANEVQALSSTLVPFRLSGRSGFERERGSELRITPVLSHPSKYRRPGSAKELITSDSVVTSSHLPTAGTRSSLQSNASSSCSSLPTTLYHDARQTLTSSNSSMDVGLPARETAPPPLAPMQQGSRPSSDYNSSRSFQQQQPMSPASTRTFGFCDDTSDRGDDAAVSTTSKRHGGGLRSVLARIAPRARLPSLPDVMAPVEGRSAPIGGLRKIIRVARKSPERPRFSGERSLSASDEHLRRPSLPTLRLGGTSAATVAATTTTPFVPLTPDTFAPVAPPQLRESHSVLSIRRWQRSLAALGGDASTAEEYAELAHQHHQQQQEGDRRPSGQLQRQQTLRPQWADAGNSSLTPSPSPMSSSPSATAVEQDEVVRIGRRGRCPATGFW